MGVEGRGRVADSLEELKRGRESFYDRVAAISDLEYGACHPTPRVVHRSTFIIAYASPNLTSLRLYSPICDGNIFVTFHA